MPTTLLRRPPVLRALALLVLGAPIACRGGGDQQLAAATASTRAGGATGALDDSTLIRLADDGRVAGREDAKLWMIEVSDFQCPYCRMWHDSTYAAIKREYVDAGRIRFAYVHLPLSSHKHAWPAAEASMCASAQGRFWPVHDGIFKSQSEWTPLPDAMPTFTRIVQGAGVDMTAWRRCMSEHQVRPLIAADAQRAESSGIRSTPSFIIGNQLIAGAHPIAVFRQVLDSALAAGARGGR